MARSSNCCSLASLVTLVILVLFPARSWCKEETYSLLTEAKSECCVNGEAELKRFDGIDYDSFVSLMGRRSAAQPNSYRNRPMSRKGRMDHILAALLGPRSRMLCLCDKEYSQKKRGQSINYETKRFQHFL